YFDGLATPRIAAVITPAKDHNFRLSYQTGFKSPIMQEQFLNLDFTAFRVIGGAPGLVAGNPAQTNSFLASSVDGFVAGFLESMGKNGGDFNKAVADNHSKLQKANFGFV